ncbi:MAG TPA: hypothetical protein VFG12_00620 [Rhodopila sp.]|nr:hypothetical protein [Rhodopila sp.]
MAEVLREDPVVAAGQDGDGTGAEALQFGEAGLVGQDVDGFELDRTDREKLFEFQAACSAGLPEDVQ